jgi:membrane protease YdiL (CAAX protease family)
MKSLSKYSGWTLAFALIFPCCFTLIYFVLLAGSPDWLQKSAYLIGKTVQFMLPIFWIGLVSHSEKKETGCQPPKMSREPWFRLFEGTLFGIFVFAAMFAAYWFYLRFPGNGLGEASTARTMILSKMTHLGVTDSRLFLLLGFFYSIIHSGLEEYYWRWFVFGQLRKQTEKFLFAAIVSSFGFTLHHIVILGTYFGFDSPLCYLASFGVSIGGFYWAWLYYQSRSIWGAWISHGIIDAAIFSVGYALCFA